MLDGGKRSMSGRTTAAILAWLDAHGPGTALDVARACDMDLPSMRGRLIALGRVGLVEAKPSAGRWSRRVYTVTAEGRRAAGIGDMQV